MSFLKRLFAPPPHAAAVEALYRQVVASARQPDFYTACGVADTPDGRFDMIVLHTVLLFRRLKDGPGSAEVAQGLFDLMFADMDQNLREMGVGDLAVGKRVKKMAQGFYGRLAAYDRALKQADAPQLQEALRRNLYRGTTPEEAQVAAIAGWTAAACRDLDAQPLPRLMAGSVAFPPAPRSPLPPPPAALAAMEGAAATALDGGAEAAR